MSLAWSCGPASEGGSDVASVFKRKRDKGNRLASWYVAYTDENGEQRTQRGCPD
jgi:hypothetical protein